MPWTNSISNKHNFKILFNSSNNNKWTNKKYWMRSKGVMNTRTSFKTREEWAKSQTNLNFQTLPWTASISTFQRPTKICYVKISIMKIKWWTNVYPSFKRISNSNKSGLPRIPNACSLTNWTKFNLRSN